MARGRSPGSSSAARRGLPGATDDVGDWTNPLGLAALAVETALVGLVLAEGVPHALRRIERPAAGRLSAADR